MWDQNIDRLSDVPDNHRQREDEELERVARRFALEQPIDVEAGPKEGDEQDVNPGGVVEPAMHRVWDDDGDST